MAVLRIVVLHKIIEIGALEGVCLERKVHVRPEVVDPELLLSRAFRLPAFCRRIAPFALTPWAWNRPVGRRRSVCTSHSCRIFRPTISPAPPSNRTSGTTTAALPFCFNRVFICWMKLSCLLDVVAHKSSRSIISVSLDTLPFSAKEDYQKYFNAPIVDLLMEGS